MDIKELNTHSYSTNSKYKRHTGKRVKDIQKSRNATLLKFDKQRKWRKYEKRDLNRKIKVQNKKNIKNDQFTCYDKIGKIVQFKMYELN